MEKLLCSILLLFISFQVTLSTSIENTQTYIIHMDTSKIPSPFPSHHSWYMSTLFLLSLHEEIHPSHLYTYTHVFNGFSAILTESHLQQLSGMPGHVSTYPESFGYLCTTHTPQFLRLNMETGLWPIAEFGDDIIIGIVDTGIWPESKSFNDDGMPPIPPRWHGVCETGPRFTLDNCNNKLIGARSFNKGMKKYGLVRSRPYDYDSPRDYVGHGTSVSSIAAGSRVPFANFFGYANGTATGMAYKSRLAIYKVDYIYHGNSNISSTSTDLLAGMDQAIEDGVDLISLTLAFDLTRWYEDPIAIATFAAMEKGIFVSCVAGNNGPDGYTISNGAPWISTVGAGTMDRGLSASITLGDTGTQIVGRSVFPENLMVDKVPLFFGHGNKSKEICESLDPVEVKGKYVFCDFNDNHLDAFDIQWRVVSTTGAAGAIFTTKFGMYMGPIYFNGSFVEINQLDGKLVKKYIRENGIENSRVSIKFQVTMLGTKSAPQVAGFSSRGPVLGAPWILKPDFLAPGVDVLTASVPNTNSNAKIGDKYLMNDFNILSGTSFSSSHMVGVAALLMSVHKQWSPAAIRSAMMTTSDIVDNANNPILDICTGVSASPLDFGAGHINPNRAMDPGLVYDLQAEDYINYMCSLNFTRVQLQSITRRSNVSCDNANIDLNYPSFIVIVDNMNATRATFKRALTSVVDGNCTYYAIVEAPSGMKVVVEPLVIYFPRIFYKSEFKVTVEIDLGNMTRINYLGNYGYLTWKEVNGSHVVRSNIVSAYPAYK